MAPAATPCRDEKGRFISPKGKDKKNAANRTERSTQNNNKCTITDDSALSAPEAKKIKLDVREPRALHRPILPITSNQEDGDNSESELSAISNYESSSDTDNAEILEAHDNRIEQEPNDNRVLSTSQNRIISAEKARKTRIALFSLTVLDLISAHYRREVSPVSISRDKLRNHIRSLPYPLPTGEYIGEGYTKDSFSIPFATPQGISRTKLFRYYIDRLYPFSTYDPEGEVVHMAVGPRRVSTNVLQGVFMEYFDEIMKIPTGTVKKECVEENLRIGKGEMKVKMAAKLAVRWVWRDWEWEVPVWEAVNEDAAEDDGVIED